MGEVYPQEPNSNHEGPKKTFKQFGFFVSSWWSCFPPQPES